MKKVNPALYNCRLKVFKFIKMFFLDDMYSNLLIDSRTVVRMTTSIKSGLRASQSAWNQSRQFQGIRLKYSRLYATCSWRPVQDSLIYLQYEYLSRYLKRNIAVCKCKMTFWNNCYISRVCRRVPELLPGQIGRIAASLTKGQEFLSLISGGESDKFPEANLNSQRLATAGRKPGMIFLVTQEKSGNRIAC